jgi:replicative DNA helicase
MVTALEYRVLSEILRLKSLHEALGAGLRSTDFMDPEARAIYKFIEDHWYHPATRNEVPLVTSIQARFTGFRMTPETSSNQFLSLVRELRMQALGNNIRSLASFMNEMADDNPEEALRLIKGRLYDIDFKWEPAKGFGIQEVVEGTKRAYEGARDGLTMGVPWPWDCLTKDTRGKHGGDLIAFYGRMKSLKTWILLKCAADDYKLYNQRVLFWSKEMTEDKIKVRLGSLLAEVDYQLLKNGKLPKKMMERAFAELDKFVVDPTGSDRERVLQAAEAGTRDLIILSGPKAPRDISGLQVAIRDYKPTVLYVDSYYHLHTPRAKENAQPWHKLEMLAEELKEMAMEFHIPVIITAQANRLGEKTLGSSLAEVSGSDRLAMETDLIIRIIKRRKGAPLHEADYEGARKEEKELARLAKKIKSGKSFLLRRNLNPTTQEDGGVVPVEDEPADNEEAPRYGAELVFILGGNREGTLEAFSIDAIPGYNFQVTSESFSVDTIAQWVAQDDAEMQREIHRTITRGEAKPPQVFTAGQFDGKRKR